MYFIDDQEAPSPVLPVAAQKLQAPSAPQIELSYQQQVVVPDQAASEQLEEDTKYISKRLSLPHFNQLVALEKARYQWEGSEMAASHGRLYSILTDCYSYYLTMTSAKTEQKIRIQMSEALETFIEIRKLNTLHNTPAMNKVVKAVFGQDRRRVSAYAVALKLAVTAGSNRTPIPADGLANWIKEWGGIEEVRKAASSGGTGLLRKERIFIATQALGDEPLMTIKPDANRMVFNTDDADKKMLLIVTYRPTGVLEVNSVVKNDSAVNAALAAYYTENKKDLAATAVVKDLTKNQPLAQALAI